MNAIGRFVLLTSALVAISGLSACSDATFSEHHASTQAPPIGKTAKLSDERTLTFSAFVSRPRRVYADPTETAHAVGRLHMTTETGRLESYVVLRAHTDKRAREWVQVRVPGNPNGRVGWVLRDALDKLHRTRWLIFVDRSKMKMTVYLNGRRHWERPVGVGKPSTPTPAGHFWIRSRIKIKKRSSPYWPYALGTSAYSSLPGWPGGGVVAIHGDAKAPGLIPGQPSHGCIRLRNEDVAWLAQRIDVGTPLWVV
jgi:lipoprotein-anchoring transpeptidase ErfK/SrfK